MADNIEKLILDDSGFINPLNDVIKRIEVLDKEYSELTKNIKEDTKKVGDTIVGENKKMATATKEAVKETQKQAAATLESAKNVKIFGFSINDVKEKLSEFRQNLIGSKSALSSIGELTMTQKRGVVDLSNALGGGRGAFIALAKGINIFKAALISTGIGALVVALGGLVSFLTKSQDGMDLVSRKTAALSGAFGVLTEKASQVGRSIVESFSNGTVIQDFGKLLEDQITNRIKGITDVFSNLWSVVTGGGKSLSDVGASLGQVLTGIKASDIKDTANEMLAAAKAAESIQKRLSELKREQAAYNVQFSKTRAEIEILKKIGDDTSKSFSVRTEAIKKGGALEQSINNKKIEFLKREIALVQERNSLPGNNTDEKKNELYALQLQLSESINDSAGKSTELQNTLNGLLKEQKDLLSGISENLIKVGREYNLVTEKEEFEFVKAKQIEQLQLFIKQLKDVGKTLGTDVTNQVKIAQQAIDGLLKQEFISVLEPLSNELPKVLFSQFPKAAEEVAKDISAKMKISIPSPKIDDSNFFDDINNFEQLLQKSLDEIFGEGGGEKAREFLLGAATLVGEFGNILNEATDLQLDSIDKQLDRLSKRRETLQDELSRELELQEKGLANNVGNKQTEVDGLLAEETRLQAEREKIQKEAQKRQLISDTIAQGQSLITSSINIIKGFSNIPIVGLPLGIAAVGALLTFFAKTKVEAFKATRLYTGAEKISDHFGYGERHGDTDLPGRGSGYRLINERTGKPTNVIISGKEMLLPESVSLPNSEFFHSLRNGVYNGIDLNAAMGFYLNYKGKVAKATQNTVIVSQNKPERQKSRVAIPHTMKNGKKGVIITTIKEDWTDGKFIEFDL